MRIHRLEISAFGPFAGTEHIDFDRLSAHGLFLLNGPTGAGKTSVLDAICFALYGSVPGARQDGKRLRSDHAEATAEPRVTCEFSASGRHFEVSRSPAWQKPSARGRSGFTVQQANTLLRERVDGGWLEKSGRNDEAGAEIAAVLGMNREQFTRVVMLPQGDFAAFLRSKAADRLELLQSLFGTQRFEAVEQELGRNAQAARSEVAGLNGRLELLLAQAEAETATLERDGEAAPDRADTDSFLPWLQARAAGAAEQHRAAALAADRQRAERLAARDAAATRDARQSRLAVARRRQSAAEAAAPAIAAKSRQLDLHRLAEVLGGQLQAVDGAARAEEDARAAMAAAGHDLRTAALTDDELAALETAAADSAANADSSAFDSAAFDGAALRPALAGLRTLRAVLEERLPEESSLAGLRSRAARLGLELAGQEDKRASGDAALAALEAESIALLASMHPLEELAAEVQLRSKEAAAAEELLVLVRRYARAETSCEAVAQRHGVARESYQDLRQGWLDLREERLANAAAELASQLLPGLPCLVCGSPEHPAPAPAAASALTVAEAEETAQRACEAAEGALASLERELAEAQQDVAVLAAQGGNTAPDVAALDAALARERAAEAQRAAAELAANRTRHAELEEESAAGQQARTAVDSSIARIGSTLAEVQEQSDALELALDKLRAGHPVLAARITAVDGATAVLERAEEARNLLEQASGRSAEARRQLELALPGTGFASAEAARGALLPAAAAAALEADVRAGLDEAVRIEELFASEDLVLAAHELATEGPLAAELVERLSAEAATAERAARDAELEAGLAEKSVRTLDTIADTYVQLAAAGQEPRERAALLTAVADAARGGGDNNYRMSLNSYVLAARLEQVALAASERLVAMSDGRYTLQHTDAKAARGQKSGLGLEVVDQWTGQRRDTATLSGGESFMASLALALGLADVVQQESGGVDIETLFVDEGFGSLDEQALEQVMDALEGLRDGGRVVGLVSHVAEMKQRISTQLQVVKGRSGSTVHISDDGQP
ncbi:SMC family ATPase [Arthrobacter sp. AL08]|uniref:AAA family ATPase n=1 Tax=unclassified Arthrobacter TaxID=235627 RepID=UPI00249B104B|nr:MULTISPECIES: SMC family ATPase [unclassified Arthrobacter]MDI3242558.1 SMC family ATPase [Arthrobacter sp. AL05]MDI3278446.1 SMC family ATPase [Arthrobacter sp. AL08]